MKVVIITQYNENYAAHDWDGQGQYPQGWKSKGGSEYVVPLNSSVFDVEEVKAVVAEASKYIEHDDEYSQEYIMSWDVIGDNEIPSGEAYEIECYKEWGMGPMYYSTVLDLEKGVSIRKIVGIDGKEYVYENPLQERAA